MFEQIFGSRARFRLLTFLFRNPEEAFYVRELTRKLGEQINSVRRELSILQRAGIVKSRAEGRRLYYRLNPEFPYREQFRNLFEKIGQLEEIPATREEERLASRLREVGHLTYALLCGAFLGKSSPVDLLLVGEVDRVRLGRLITEFERELGRELNYTVLTPEEFSYRLGLYDRFLGEIMDSDKMVVIDEQSPPKES